MQKAVTRRKSDEKNINNIQELPDEVRACAPLPRKSIRSKKTNV